LRGLLDTTDQEAAPEAAASSAAPEDWLRGLSEPEPEIPETGPQAPAVPSEEPVAVVGSDDWLRSMVAEPVEATGEPPSFELEEPEWLERLVAPDSTEHPGATLEAPDWVKALAAMEPGPEAAPSAEEPEEPATPEWLGRVLGAEPERPAELEEPEEDEPPPWLAQPSSSGLAAGGPAGTDAESEPSEGLGIAAAAATRIETPDWLREFADAAADEPPTPTARPAATTPPPPDLEYEGALDWLREGETGPIRPEDIELTAPSPASGATTPAGAVDDEEIFRWLDDLAQRQPEESVPSGIVPRSTLPPMEPPPPPPSRAPIPEDADAGMEWLEQLAGVQEPSASIPEPAAQIAPEVPPARFETPPAPVEEVIAVEPTPPTPPRPERRPAPPAEPEEEDITLWLKSLSMPQPEQPAAPAPVPIPPMAAAVAAAGAAPAPQPDEPVEPVAEQPPRKPTWTPVDESWLQPTPAPPAPRSPEPIRTAAPPPPVVEAPAAPARQTAPAAKPRAKAAGPADALTRARQHLADGEFDKASKDYSTVIKKKYELDTVIDDLRMAAEHFPTEPGLWQLLGDAYMRADRLDEAVDAYNRGIQAA
jgi:hypothetical protein